MQLPALQVCPGLQARPQAPQFAGSRCKSRQAPLQRVNPDSHPHLLEMHLANAPEQSASPRHSTQRWLVVLQKGSGLEHWPLSWQPITQVCVPRSHFPPGHSASFEQATHECVLGSQTGLLGSEQFPLLVQATQVALAVSQYGMGGAQSPLLWQPAPPPVPVEPLAPPALVPPAAEPAAPPAPAPDAPDPPAPVDVNWLPPQP